MVGFIKVMRKNEGVKFNKKTKTVSNVFALSLGVGARNIHKQGGREESDPGDLPSAIFLATDLKLAL